MKEPILINHIDELMSEVGGNLANHSYSAGMEDYKENNDGVRIYDEKYVIDMPTDYAILLGRYGTLAEIKTMLDEEYKKELLGVNLDKFESYRSRFQIKFDE